MTRWLSKRYSKPCIFAQLPGTLPGRDRSKEGCLIPRKDNGEEHDSKRKANVTLPGTVEKIIPAVGDHIPEKAEIKIEGADDLYREVRIENEVIDEEGNPLKLKKGAELDVTIEANKKDTKPEK
jgi:hypothetical protein